MRGLQTKRTQCAPSRFHRSQQKNLLLIGSEQAFKSRGVWLIDSLRLRVIARASDLAEAFTCIDSGTIDLLLFSSEFRDEELTSFARDARCRGFLGLILHAVDTPEAKSGTDSEETDTIRIGDFVIDIPNHQLWIRGIQTPCSPKEFDLLKLFCKHPKEVLSYRILLGQLWGDPSASANALKALIRNLRAKVEITAFPRYIVKERQLGYRFNPAPRMSP